MIFTPKRRRYCFPTNLFFRVIFFPTAIIFPSPLYNFSFNFIHHCLKVLHDGPCLIKTKDWWTYEVGNKGLWTTLYIKISDADPNNFAPDSAWIWPYFEKFHNFLVSKLIKDLYSKIILYKNRIWIEYKPNWFCIGVHWPFYSSVSHGER